jgi:tetratricopeptide (TPR) repeat protein
MLTSRGQVKIMDFGLAKLKGDGGRTRTSSTLGTAAYMSPEQAQGERADQRSDVFSFGVVLYELLTGHLPFGGEHPAAILYSIINEEPQPVARFNNQVSAKLEDMIFKALAKEKEERYQHVDDLLADLRREKKSLEYMKTTQIPREIVAPRRKKRLLPLIVPASVVFILALLFLILKPFKVEVGPEKSAVAKENSLAIMYFDNMVDPEDNDRIAQMITSLLITDLSESQYMMRVVSRQRLYDIMKLLGKEDLKVIDRSVASEVARKADVKWILTGDILQIDPNIVLTSDISEAATGKILSTQRVTGEEGEDLFSVVDELSAQIKEDLSLPGGAKKELDRAVADVTTHSPEAYRYYLEGIDYYNKVYFTEAAKSYKKALEHDSTFAMAYFRLALLEDWEEPKKLMAKAVEYSDKVSQKEKYYIKTSAAAISGDDEHYLEGLRQMAKHYPEDKEVLQWLANYYYGQRQFEEAIRYFNQAIKVDPLFKLIYNMLAYAYDQIGDFEKSIWAINKYISIAPDEANPYDTRADLYAWNGKIEQAIQSYKKALEVKPDFYASLRKLGHMYLFRREYAMAESCYKELSSSDEKDIRSGGRTYLAILRLYQGKFQEALQVLDQGIAADKMEQVPGAFKYLLKAFINKEKKDLGAALREAESSVEVLTTAYPDRPVNMRDFYAYFLAESGKTKQANEVVDAIRDEVEEKYPSLMHYYWRALGHLEFTKGNAEAATTYLRKGLLGQAGPVFGARYYLAKAYLESGRLGEEVAVLEKALLRYDEEKASLPIWAVKAHYLLAVAYEKSGWSKKAMEQYEEFLEIWKDADPGIPEVEDARERLEKLRVES